MRKFLIVLPVALIVVLMCGTAFAADVVPSIELDNNIVEVGGSTQAGIQIIKEDLDPGEESIVYNAFKWEVINGESTGNVKFSDEKARFITITGVTEGVVKIKASVEWETFDNPDPDAIGAAVVDSGTDSAEKTIRVVNGSGGEESMGCSAGYGFFTLALLGGMPLIFRKNSGK